MRKSVRKDDPGYDPNARWYKVFLDGSELHDCFTADEEMGRALVHERGENGRFVIEEINGEPTLKNKVLSGKVEIRLRASAHLEELFGEYLTTLDDAEMEERYQTPCGFASDEIRDFIEFIKSKQRDV